MWCSRHILIRFDRKLDMVLAAVAALSKQERTLAMALADDLQALTDQTAQNTSVEASAVQAINGLIATVEDLKTQVDPNTATVIEAAVAQMKQSAAGLAAAIPQNTTPPTP